MGLSVSDANAKRTAGAGPHLVWITRARPGADATAERVRQLGVEPIVAPLLEVRRAPLAPIDLEGVSAIVFTSANAVSAFADRCAERTLRVFAVGDATAAAARMQRFSNVLSAQGDVAALAASLAARRRELPGVILYPAAAEPAQDLAGALEAAGLAVRQITIYETVVIDPDEVLVARLGEVDGVLLHSAKAARALAGFLKSHPSPGLTAFCLSRQIARSLGRAGLASVVSAEAPTETALLALVAG